MESAWRMTTLLVSEPRKKKNTKQKQTDERTMDNSGQTDGRWMSVGIKTQQAWVNKDAATDADAAFGNA